MPGYDNLVEADLERLLERIQYQADTCMDLRQRLNRLEESGASNVMVRSFATQALCVESGLRGIEALLMNKGVGQEEKDECEPVLDGRYQER